MGLRGIPHGPQPRLGRPIDHADVQLTTDGPRVWAAGSAFE
jgi:hypothetical protein